MLFLYKAVMHEAPADTCKAICHGSQTHIKPWNTVQVRQRAPFISDFQCIHFWDYVCVSCKLMKMHDHIYSTRALSHSSWVKFITGQIHHTVKAVNWLPPVDHACIRLEGKLAEVNSISCSVWHPHPFGKIQTECRDEAPMSGRGSHVLTEWPEALL